jgi:Ca-activated chloride channel family protein
MPVELTSPWGLLFLLAVPAALFVARRSLAGLEGARRVAAIAVRVLVLALLALAAAGPRVRFGSSDLTVVFVVDASASVSADGRREALELVDRLAAGATPRDRVGVVVFGGDASVERALREGGLGTRLDRVASSVRSSDTDIAGALRLAGGLVPEGTTGRIVLLTDGNETRGSATDEARRLRARGIAISCHALPTGGQPEIALAGLRVPESPAAGESFDLRVEVTATRDTAARLRVFRNGVVVAERDVELLADGANVFLLPQRLDEKGFFTYRAEIESVAADGFAENNSREGFAYVQGPPRALFVYGDERPSAPLLSVFADGKFLVDSVPARAMPPHLADLQNYDLIVFDNVSAETLAASQLRDVRSYVRDLGGGFVMIGGDKSFGAGGYFKTPIEEALPVSLDVRRKKHYPGLAMVLVVDKSGSMAGAAGVSKMDLAKEGAIVAVDFLADSDAVGVIAFDDASKEVVPLADLAGKKDEVKSLIGTIVAGGGTTIYPALKTAYDRLAAYEAPLKHIILLSDGQSNEGDYAGLVAACRAQKITLSTVAVGSDADLRLMQFLAEGGGGRFYISEDIGSLPRIFTKEAFLASRSTVVEEPTPARPAQPSQATSGIDWSAAPLLAGYIGSSPKDTATTALITHHDDPLYASWQYGLGRSAAFTSDAKPKWAASWMGWDGFSTFWTQVFRDVVRRQSNDRLRPVVTTEGGEGHVTVDAYSAEGRAANGLDLLGRVIGPDGAPRDVTLRQTAPGRYEADFPAPVEGAYLVNVVSGDEGGGNRVTGAVRAYSPEFEVRETDRDLLERIATASGGSVVGEDARLFEQRGWATRPRDAWPWLVLAALLLLPLDVGIRRVRLSRGDVADGVAWVRKRFGLAASEAPAPAEEDAGLAALKATKRRAVMTVDARPQTAETAETAQPNRTIPPEPRQAPPPTPPPAPPPYTPPDPSPTAGESRDALASRLLDARRRRGRSEE